MKKINKVGRVFLSGGLIGWLLTNPKKALDGELSKSNAEGWEAIQVQSHRTTNLFMLFVQILVLMLTLGLYTWGGGYLVLYEKIDS